MSKRVIDLINRSLKSAGLQYSKKNYKKSLAFAEKACKQARDKNMVEMLNHCLLIKGNILEVLDRAQDALIIYEEAYSLAYERFLEESEDTQRQSELTDCIEYFGSVLYDIDEMIVNIRICMTYRQNFDNILRIYSEMIVEENTELLKVYADTAHAILTIYIMGREVESHKGLALDILDMYEKQLSLDQESESALVRAFDLADEYVMVCIGKKAADEGLEILSGLQGILDRHGSMVDRSDISLIRIEELFMLCYGLKGDTDSVNAHLERSIEMEDDPDDRFSLLNDRYCMMGSVYLDHNEHELAAFYYEKVLESAEYILEAGVNLIEHVDEYIEVFEILSDVFSRLDMSDKEIECYMAQIKVLELSLESEPEEPVGCHLDIAQCYSDIAEVYSEIDKYSEASTYYEKGIAVYRKLLEDDPDNLDYRFSIAKRFNSIAALYMDIDLNTSEKYFNMALEFHEDTFDLGDMEGEDIYCNTLTGLGRVEMARHEYDKSISRFKEAIDILEIQLKDNPDQTGSMFDLIPDYRYIAEAFYELGDRQTAMEFASKSLEMNFRLIKTLSEYTSYAEMSIRSIVNDGIRYLSEEKYDLSVLFLIYALDGCENELAGEHVFSGLPESAVFAVQYLCKVSLASGQCERIVEMRQRLIKILETAISRSFQKFIVLEEASLAHTFIGLCCINKSQLDLAREAFESSLKLYEYLDMIFPHNAIRLQNEISTLQTYSNLLLDLGLSKRLSEYAPLLEKKKKELEEMRDAQDG